jgi:hypothetical protein
MAAVDFAGGSDNLILGVGNLIIKLQISAKPYWY